jgi:hypothetical protein
MINYFFEVHACWLVFYSLYFLLLSQQTFFKLNRIYLIISLLVGLLLPVFASWFVKNLGLETSLLNIMLPVFTVGGNALNTTPIEQKTGAGFSFLQILTGFYLLGVLFFSVRFLKNLSHILKKIRTSEQHLEDGFIRIDTAEGSAPFSFLKYVFICKKQYSSADFENIMRHEKTHVKQFHTLDLIFLEILRTLFWFSPMPWMYKKSLVIVHEYLADAHVLRHTPKLQYGTLLIQQVQSGTALVLTNSFLSQLKKRIVMMTRNPSKPRNLIRYAAVFPCFFLLVSFMSAYRESETKMPTLSVLLPENTPKIIDLTYEKETIPVVIPTASLPKTAPQVVESLPETVIEQPLKTVVDTLPIYSIVDNKPEFTGGNEKLFQWLGANMKYPEDAKKYGIQGTVYIAFVIEPDGSISNTRLLRNVAKSIDTIHTVDPVTYETKTKIVQNQNVSLAAEAMRVVATMPKWTAGLLNNKPVRVSYTLPIKFKLD